MQFNTKMMVQNRGRDGRDADGKTRRNEPKSRSIMVFKISAIFSRACGSRRRAPKRSHQNGYKGKERLVSEEHGLALKKTRVARADVRKRPTHHLTFSLSRILRTSSGFSLRKWKIRARSANGVRGSFLKPGFRRIIGKGDERTKKAEEAGRDELCKKRILMGEKCRPLNQSGVLHYDEQGILLPED